MSRPFFTVVIPTRDRPDRIGTAIQSVLRQSFHDFEVVVADSDETGQTEKIVHGMRDKRVRHIFTGRLNMADNWEKAFSFAEGDYVTLLEDKNILKSKSLTLLSGIISDHRKPEMVVWGLDEFKDMEAEPGVLEYYRTGKTQRLNCEEVIKKFSRSPAHRNPSALPRTLNSCLGRTLIHKILKHPPYRLCPSVSSDYSIAFLQLMHGKELLYTDSSLGVFGGQRLSIGLRNMRKELSPQDYKKFFGIESVEEFCSHLSVKLPIVQAAIYNEYEKLRLETASILNKYPLSKFALIEGLKEGLEQAEKMGIDVAVEREKLGRSFKAFPWFYRVYHSLWAALYRRHRDLRASYQNHFHPEPSSKFIPCTSLKQYLELEKNF